MLKKQDTFVAYGLFVTGTVQLLLMIIIIMGSKGDSFNRFLYNAFHISAIYIPFLQYFGAYLIIKRPLNKFLFYCSIASIFIFFPVATLLKMLFSDRTDPVIKFLHSSFDTPDRTWGSAFILLGIIAILVLSSKIIIKSLLSEETDEPQEHTEDIKSESNPFKINEDDLDFDDDLESEENIGYNFESDIDDEQELFDELELDEETDLDEEIELDEVLNLNKNFSTLDTEDPEEESEELSTQIAQIKKEINDYYVEEEEVRKTSTENIPFEEPSFPEAREEVDIDALDESSNILSDIINTEISKDEEDYLNSFDDVETFNVAEEIEIEQDPAIAFLSSDEDIPEEINESYDLSDIDDRYEAIPEEIDEAYATSDIDDRYEAIPEEIDEAYATSDIDDRYEAIAEEINEAYDTSDIDDSYEDIPEEINKAYKTSAVEPKPTQGGLHNIREKRVLTPSEPSYEELNGSEEYLVPVEGILNKPKDHSYEEIDEATKRSAAILEQTLEEFNIKGKVTGIKKGPVITMFELLPAPGVKLSKIVNLSDNIALGLAASSVRIVAPIPGKHAVGIEVPNKKRSVVTFNELIEADDSTYDEGAVPIVLGKSINGDDKIIDLAKTPHLLIAGATGAGKSVCVNSLICSILCKRSPQDVKLIMVDPKIVELKLYNGIPHLLTPVITDPKRAYQAIQWCLYEMERRYALLDSMGVRDIKTYNKRIKEQKIATTKLPYLVLIVDEFADLMATSGKELEGILARLAAMSRAVGIHLVLATQRPSIDVITGLIKANFPSRIAFMVSSKTDSRIILDGMGAEKLLGRGDMLFTSSWDPFPVRIQGSFLDDEEVEGIVDYVKTFGEPEYIDDEIFIDDSDDSDEESEKSFFGDDPLYNRALEVVLTAGKASASFLQRRLKIGYNRAARLVEEMEERGIIGPQNGSKPRDILKVPDSHKEVGEFV